MVEIAVATKKCLLVDDEASICKTIQYALEPDGWSVEAHMALEPAKQAARNGHFDFALIDLKLGDDSGLELLPMLRRRNPQMPIVIITAYASIPSAVDAVKRGANDYLPKPFNPQELRQAVAQVAASLAAKNSEAALEAAPDLDSKAPQMKQLYSLIDKAAVTDMTVLLLGETGTGKGVLAHRIHERSRRKSKPFVVVPCPSLSPELLESELFGHEKGAFTGAYREHRGRLAQAEGGTLFMDEIGDMPLALQTKLLRLFQTKEYERLGGSETFKANVRFITATHVNLSVAVREGKFREDLYFRLNGLVFSLPPLRERMADLEDLANGMLAELCLQNGRSPLRLSKAVIAAFRRYDWPGNLREMHNVLERASVFAEGKEVKTKDLNLGFRPEEQPVAELEKPELASIEEMELSHIKKVIASSKNMAEAAEILGIDYATLWRRRRKYGL